MGRLVVSELMSIDGVSEAPGGEPGYRHTNWVGKRHETKQIEHKFQEVLDHEALLVGRVTYESFAGAWPTYNGPFADRMNSMPKYVVSSTLRNPSWNNTTVLQGEPIAAIIRLKQSLRGGILVEGSRTLANALRRHGLVDEYRLMMFPVILGSGAQFFDRTEDATNLRLTATHSFANGAIELTYRVLRGEEI
ncbi:MAG: dihydrofolate reductase [Mesorhizobium sp.]|uniref:dihydrofolate reductase family protein n=1 Tax=Mesorhizobium sp. TaxID=1871066 RepID=UPI000FE81EEC|nr:dihydrofolate reductase family protein [Mesorhizobium sp.]RWB73529.1 MAG: dihydrofolate reductase [Mesorhizobium sp.]